jgi:hypothetical protein
MSKKSEFIDGIPEPRITRHRGPWLWHRRHGRVLLSGIAITSARIWSEEYRRWLYREVDDLVARGAVDRGNGDVLDPHIAAALAEDTIRVQDEFTLPIAQARDVARQHENRHGHAADRIGDLDRQINEAEAHLASIDAQLAERREPSYLDIRSIDQEYK